MVVCLLKFIALVIEGRVKDEIHLLIDQPGYMTVCQLGRIALGLAGNGFDTHFVNLTVGIGG